MQHSLVGCHIAYLTCLSPHCGLSINISAAAILVIASEAGSIQTS